MGNIAIVVVTYDRLSSLKRLLDCLIKADFDGEEVPLFVSVDKSGNDRTEKFASTFEWPHGPYKAILHPENLGLRRHILSCGDLLDTYEAVIVLEDDLTVRRDFYRYAKACVKTYDGDPAIAGISLYSFRVNYNTRYPFLPVRNGSDVYLMHCAMSWGEVWMRDAWRRFRQWYDTHSEPFGDLAHLPGAIGGWGNNSWLKYHTRYCIEEGKYFVFPYESLSTNNGDPGTHTGGDGTFFQAELALPRKGFVLPPAGDIRVRYDGYFEAEYLAETLGIPADELCVDLSGSKLGRVEARYRLTLASLPYRQLASYALSYRPIEMNILMDSQGDAIHLYDTAIPDVPPAAVSKEDVFAYWYGNSYIHYLRFFGIWGASRMLMKTLFRKFKNRLK